MSTGMSITVPSKLPRNYWVSAEALIPPIDYKESWVNIRLNLSLKKEGKIKLELVYKEGIESPADDVKIRAYMLLHMLASAYEKLGIWPDDKETEIQFIKSDTGRPLLDVKNFHSQVQFSLMKWVTPDWLELPKVPAMAKYMAKIQDIDPSTYHLFLKTRPYILPKSDACKVNWEVNVF